MKSFAAILVSLVLTFATRPAAATRAVAGRKTLGFIKTSCVDTPYPALCHTSLSCHEKEIGTDTELLAHAALNVALDAARPLSDAVADLAHNKTLPPEAMSDMNNCVEELKDSVHKLKMSLVEMKQLKCPGFDAKITYIQTLIAAALTDDDRCTDGFNVTGLKEPEVKEQIEKVAHLTINALALLNKFAATEFPGRKNVEFVKSSCQATPFPNICYDYLSSYACEIAADPKLLAQNAIAITLNTTESTVSRMVEIADSVGLSPKQNMSILVCEDLSHKSIAYIEDCLTYLETISEQKGNDLVAIIDNIKDWLKAVKNNYEWCIDELEREKIDRKVTDAVTELMRKVEPFSLIALALFNGFAARLTAT